MNDLLNDQDLYELTGVKPGAHGRVEKIIDVLRQAGIHHWLRYDGTIATTWTHVHRAGEQQQPAGREAKRPNFDAIKHKAA